MSDEAERLATELWRRARDDEECARRIPDDRVAGEVRRIVRRLARAEGIAVRTARMGDGVAVVRLDARLWHEDAATMRERLTPP